MVPDNFPRGTFRYGRDAAIEVRVEYVESPTRIIAGPGLWGVGENNRAEIEAASVERLAKLAAVTPLEAAHFLVATIAAMVAVGRAYPRLVVERIAVAALRAMTGDPVAVRKFAVLAQLRDILMAEVAPSLARWHADPVDAEQLEKVRKYLTTTLSDEMEWEREGDGRSGPEVVSRRVVEILRADVPRRVEEQLA